MAKNFLNDLFLFVTPNFLHWSVPFRLSPLSATVARVTSDPPVAETKMVDSQSSSHLWSLAFDAVDYCPLLFFFWIFCTLGLQDITLCFPPTSMPLDLVLLWWVLLMSLTLTCWCVPGLTPHTSSLICTRCLRTWIFVISCAWKAPPDIHKLYSFI